MSTSTPTRKNLSTRSKLVKTAAVLTLAAAATLAVPAIAQAYVPTVPGASVSSATVEPGGSVNFAVEAGTFEAGETITITLIGANANSAALAMANPAAQRSVLGTRNAETDGSLAPVRLALPASASGAYEVLATSASVPDGVRAAFTVTVSGSQAGALPVTGTDRGALVGAWVGGGALILAGGAVIVGRAVRRSRTENAE